MKRIPTSIGLLLLFLSLPLHATVLTGPITNSSNGHLYYLLSPTTVGAAETEAATLGGHLVTINDALENAWVLGTFGLYGGVPRSMWIGLNDVANEGQFVWLDGDSSAYRYWAVGEPNNGAGVFPYEDTVIMIDPLSPSGGMWRDAIDSQNHAAVVEVVPVTPGNVVLAGPITNMANGHVYYLLRSTNYSRAIQIATNLGGHLAYINDATENSWILNTFGNYGGQARSLWIGLNDIQEEGTFVWGSNQPAYYQNWAPGEPNSGGGFFPDEDYTMMWGIGSGADGMWNDAGDTSEAEAVVELGEDSPPRQVAAAIRISEVEISWSSTLQFGYQVQYSTNVAAGNWFNLGGPLLGTGSPMFMTDLIPGDSPGRYYRVLSSQ